MTRNNTILETKEFADVAKEIVATVHTLSQNGWTPATSSNFSSRIKRDDELIAISKSGTDKNSFSIDHVMVIDKNGDAYAPLGCKPSAETLLHTMLYEDSAISSVLHTHSANATVISMQYGNEKCIKFSDFEILKGIQGNKTHAITETVPIFRNSQDIDQVANEVRTYKKSFPKMHGFLIEGHGLYSWGASISDAKRHIEVFEFLFECYLRSK